MDCKLSKKQTFKGQGFSFKVPEGFENHLEDDPNGDSGFGEFLQSYIKDGESVIRTNAFFYYWEKAKHPLSDKASLQLVKEVCSDKLFTSKYSLKLIEKIPVGFEGYPALLMKFRYRHHDPMASGPANFFVIHNPKQAKVFVLGILIDQNGNPIAERETLAWIEDEVILSFRFSNRGG